MKKKNIFAALMVLVLIVTMSGCGKSGTDSSEDVQLVPLTDKELAYFNGTEFFNKEYLNNVVDSINIHNQFLSSLYDKPEDIDLFELFYCGSETAEPVTDEETSAAAEAGGMSGAVDFVPPPDKISTENMNEVLLKNTGLTVDQTNKVGLEELIYLEQYDAYYHFHGDTNYRMNVEFSSGERQGDLIRLTYEDTFMADGEKIITLREQDGKYLFVSNEKKQQ